MRGVRLLEVIVVLGGLVQQIRKRGNVPSLRHSPLAAGKSRSDLLEHPAVPVRIFE
jgi:hypothetical protein